MTTWAMRRYPNLLAPLEVSDGNGLREEFAHIADAWDYIGGHMSWGDSVDTEDMTAPASPDPATRAQHASRASGPATSQQAARNRAPGWDTMNGRALRVLFDHRNEPEGLCAWEVQQYAEVYGGLGTCEWKRFGELYTEWNPPLADQTFRANGTPITHPGETGEGQDCYRINQHGLALYWESQNTQ